MMVSALSHQLRTLPDRGAVGWRKEGGIVYYRLVDEQLRRLVRDGVARVAESAA